VRVTSRILVATLGALTLLAAGAVALLGAAPPRQPSPRAIEVASIEAPLIPPATPSIEAAPSPRAPIPRAERPQFVLLGMDTTPHGHRHAFEDLFELLNARRAPATPPITFTLFIGTASFQLDPDRRRITAEERAFVAVPPRPSPVFDYAASLDEIEETAENVRRLAVLGVEIGSHTVRHARGGGWTRERWEMEMTDHARILALVGLPAPVGFRAPFLDTNDAMYESLDAHGFGYDCSETHSARFWPIRHPGTDVWQFGVPSVEIPGRDRPVLFYDLNLDARLRRAAADAGVHGDDAVQAWMDETFFQIALDELETRYRGSRAPFLVSGHGGFRVPITRLMRRVCGMPDVRCTTFREAAEYMRAHPEMEGAG
jgi:hypothetical protein